jgi:hypothetical protein
MPTFLDTPTQMETTMTQDAEKTVFDGRAFERATRGRIDFGTPEGDALLSSPALAPFMPGQGRDAYLAWVQAWKAQAGFSAEGWDKRTGLQAHNLYALRRHSRRLATIDYARARPAAADQKAA